MKLWIVSELFFPNESATAYILTLMAKKFAEAYEVSVICADTNYEGDSKRITNTSQGLEGIDVLRVNASELDKNNIIKRILRFLSVSRMLYCKAKEVVHPGDIVFAVTNPAFLLPYMKRLKKDKGIVLYLLVHDVFPENALASGVLRFKPIYTLLKRVFDKSYAAADKILVLGEDMRTIVAAKIGHSENVYVCENWGASDIPALSRTRDGKIVLQYAGNIGRVQGLEEWVRIASKIDNTHLVFDFWGSGALIPSLEEYVQNNNLSNIRIRGSYNRSTQGKVLNECDIAVICLAKGMKGLGVPSKTYNILAAGKPILYIGDEGSEIFDLVVRFDLGFAFTWEQIDKISSWLESLDESVYADLERKGKRSRECYERYFTQEIILNKTLNCIKIERAI